MSGNPNLPVRLKNLKGTNRPSAVIVVTFQPGQSNNGWAYYGNTPTKNWEEALVMMPERAARIDLQVPGTVIKIPLVSFLNHDLDIFRDLREKGLSVPED